MPTVTSDQGLSFPADPDLNDAATAFGTLLGANPSTGVSGITGVETRLVKRYLSATDRSTRNPSPAAGELSWRGDAKLYEYYTGSQWTALQSGVIFAHRDGSGVNPASNFAGETTIYTRSIPLSDNRTYRAKVGLSGISGGATFPLQFGARIKSAGVQLVQATATMSASAVEARAEGETIFTTGSGAGSPTFTITALRLVGSVNLDVTAAATSPFIFYIEDMGPSTLPV